MQRQFSSMKATRNIIIILFYSTLLLPACTSKKSGPADNLNEQAHKMSDAFLKEDFETVADYTSPLVFELVGGKANLIEGLKKSVEAMKVQQMKFQTISFEKPSEILSYNGQLQATIVQRTEIKYAGGTLKSISTLIAISADEGNTWKFIDTSGKDAIAIRKAFPRLSPDLRLPSGQQSVQ